MMYENRLATTPSPRDFDGAGANPLSSRVIDYEDGPVAIGDTSEGNLFQVWQAKIIGSDVLLSADNTPEYVLFSAPSITDISIAFDQNANLYYCWVSQGVTYFRWYDSLTSAYVVSDFGTTMITPKITLDDKRADSSGRSDVIFAYVKASDGKLYFRQQRDRFSVERLLADGPFVSIERMYFNTGYALQFKMTAGYVG